VDDRSRWQALLADAADGSLAGPQRICQLCVDTLSVSGAGISMVTHQGNRGVVCATDEVSSRIEDLQFTLGEGPCVDAVVNGAPILIADLDEPDDLAVERWPAFLEGAGAEEIRAVFAFPLLVGAISVGALDLYRKTPGELDAVQLSEALHAADAAAVALLRLHGNRADMFADDPAMRSSYHLQVHQATGMVQTQLGVDTEEAFLLLRARAFSTGRSLVAVASDVVDRRLRFSQEDQ
jgi:hypothetical protein